MLSSYVTPSSTDDQLLKLPIPSDEKREILNCFKQGYNIKIEAVAGSGKSTTLLLLATEVAKWGNISTLILTYNKGLRDETHERIKLLGLSGCEIYTYHGYASKLYKQNIHTNVKLRECLNRPVNPTPHQVILLDEVQDMNIDYHKLISKILSHGKILILVGDRKQCINQYINATSEYLINYVKYFDTGRPWKELQLKTSYRLTPSLAAFVNRNILCENVIIAGNNKYRDLKPIYRYGIWDMEPLIVQNCIDYGCDEVVIMMPSIRNITPKSPIGSICQKQIPGILFCVRDGDASPETMKGKVLITSYNSMKGLEKRCVILIGFDESYFEYYDKTWEDRKSLPNILYVASTRCKERLIIVQDERKQPLRTITQNNLHETCIVTGGRDLSDRKPDQSKLNKTYGITDLTRHRSTNDTMELISLLHIEHIQSDNDHLPYQNVIQFDGYYEDMRRYYGILIPLLSQFKKTGKIDWAVYPEPSGSQTQKKVNIEILRIYNSLLVLDDKDEKQWMELTVLHDAIMSNCHFYYYQIKHYNWVDVNFINTQVDRILKILTDDNGVFEYPCDIKRSAIAGNSHHICGSFDYFVDTHIWEFKCSNSLEDEHLIQCGAYISLYHNFSKEYIPCNLFNTRTGEIIRITVADSDAYLKLLVKHKLYDTPLL